MFVLVLVALPCTAGQTSSPVIVATSTDQSAASTLPGIMNRMTIVLDAAHGGDDDGAHISDSIQEKDITLALALKLQSLLTARGLTVVMIRSSNNVDKANTTGTALTLDDRAGIANHARASACLLLHAASSGHGVHLYSSELTGTPYEASVLPWLTAQAPWVAESAHLERQLAESLRLAGVPRIVSHASVRPVDSLTCPAVVVELAPETDTLSSVTGNDYQQRVAEALAGALERWPTQTQPPARQATNTKAKPAGAQP